MRGRNLFSCFYFVYFTKTTTESRYARAISFHGSQQVYSSAPNGMNGPRNNRLMELFSSQRSDNTRQRKFGCKVGRHVRYTSDNAVRVVM